jgi:hypothetical protein
MQPNWSSLRRLGAVLGLGLILGSPAALRAADTLSSVLEQLKAASQSSPDATLKSLGEELGAKTGSLGKTLGTNGDLTSQLADGVKALLGGGSGGGGESLSRLQKLAAAASFTPAQKQLAKEVGNLGSAYLVQKNLAGLEGAQGDVATIVSSLRKGEVSKALPAVQKVAANAKLTPAQKQLVTSLAEQYAPGTGKVSDALKALPQLPGTGK